eukprot:829737-Amphidinium_carterae.2
MHINKADVPLSEQPTIVLGGGVKYTGQWRGLDREGRFVTRANTLVVARSLGVVVSCAVVC